MRIDLNGDMGESFGSYHMGADEALMPLVSSVNIACGFHAGDPLVLDRTVALAKRHGVTIGAHPGYADLRGFGRRPIASTPEEIESDVLYQIGALDAFIRSHGARLAHAKAHGALYNQAASDPVLARALARGIARFRTDVIMVGLAGSTAMRKAAEVEGLRYAGEAFADRVYNPDGTLQSRGIAGSVIDDPDRAARQAVSIVSDGCVEACDGTRVFIDAVTLCLHGDNPAAVENARAVRRALERAGVEIRPLG